MKTRIVLLLLFTPVSIICSAQIKDFYKTTSNAAILLYKKTNGRLIAHGTAFLLCNNDNGSDETILVTCEHVTHHDTLIAAIPATDSLRREFLKNKQTTISFASNSGIQTIGFDGNNLLFDIPIKPGINSYPHANLDLVAIFCDLPNTMVNNENNVVSLSNLKTLPKSYISEKNEMYAGQEITFVGFPSGIGTQNGFYGTSLGRDQRTNPLFRKGIISWTSDNADIFLVDGFSYGGNSGSPIFSIPNSESEGKLIGMVFGHLNDEIEIKNVVTDSLDDAIKSTTSLHINNGLAKCIPAYLIYDFALQAVKSRSMVLSHK
ncbi:MAG: trypsin-like peptidase domain-containing protein [Ferruginibacter sp.]